jgi:hypothetical protein
LGGTLGCSFEPLRFGHRRAVLFRCRDLHRIVSLPVLDAARMVMLYKTGGAQVTARLARS